MADFVISLLKAIFGGDSSKQEQGSHAWQGQPPHGWPQGSDQLHQNNEHYVSLRARANQEGDKMAECFARSQQAYTNGDRALAKELSNEGKAHKQKMEDQNKQASDWIFRENNKDSSPGEINLHGLYVKEAIDRTEQAIQEAKRRGDREIRLIVGKGLHSLNHVAKIKPAIEELMHTQQLVVELDPSNAGILTIHIDGRANRARPTVIGPDEIAQWLKQKDSSCVIM